MKTFNMSLFTSGEETPMHDQSGDPIQTHEADNGDLIITFGDDWLKEMNWLAGDTLSFQIDADLNQSKIVNVSAEERKRMNSNSQSSQDE